MQWWAASNEEHPNNNLGKWLGVFAVFVVTSLLTLAAWSWYNILEA
jgi:ATP-binding cassette subfamily C (CFTR/MRP) protein 1